MDWEEITNNELEEELSKQRDALRREEMITSIGSERLAELVSAKGKK